MAKFFSWIVIMTNKFYINQTAAIVVAPYEIQNGWCSSTCAEGCLNDGYKFRQGLLKKASGVFVTRLNSALFIRIIVFTFHHIGTGVSSIDIHV